MAFLAISNLSLHANDDPQFWQVGLQPIGEYKSVVFSLRQEYRLDMPRWKCVDARFSLFSRKPLTKNLDFEFHYTIINFRSRDDIWYNKRHRFEFELNPRTYIDSKTFLFFRNRIELVKFEQRKSWVYVFRQRTQITRHIDNTIYKNISMHHETFYNLNTNRVFEYRFCPVDILFKLKDPYGYRIFFLYRIIRSDISATASEWSSQAVLGSSFEW